MQVALVVLHAVVAFGVDHRPQLEPVSQPGLNAMLFQYLGDDLRHAELLEDALVQPVRQVGQLGHQRQAVARQALTGFTLGDAMDHPMDPTALVSEREEGRLVQQGFEVQVGAFADQLEIESVGLADGLAAAEFEHLQVML